MIKAIIGNTIILGLSEENIIRLKQDQPVKVDLKEMGLQDQKILIVYGSTEEDLFNQLKPLIGPNTKINKL